MERRAILTIASRKGLDDFMTSQVGRYLTSGLIERSLVTPGISDVTLARCFQLSRAYQKGIELEFGFEDVVVLMDDDMEVPTETLQRLILRCGKPVSGVYRQLSNEYAMGILDGKCCVGLGLVAMTFLELSKLCERSPSFSHETNAGLEVVYAVTSSGFDEGLQKWVSEDYRLSLNVGGVQPYFDVVAGHRKHETLWPDSETQLLISSEEDKEIAERIFSES